MYPITNLFVLNFVKDEITMIEENNENNPVIYYEKVSYKFYMIL